MRGYMFDTNSFNRILVEDVQSAISRGCIVYATHVQREELGRTPSEDRRAKLLATFTAIQPVMRSTSIAVRDDSLWDESRYSADDSVYRKMLERLQEIDRESGKRPKDDFNQSRDVRIAETAIREKVTLVTGDAGLLAVTNESGGRAIGFEQFQRETSAC